MNNQYNTISRSWLVAQAKKYKSKLIMANVIAVIATLISVPIPLMMPLMVDEVLLDTPASGLALMDAVLPQAWQNADLYAGRARPQWKDRLGYVLLEARSLNGCCAFYFAFA